MYSSVGDVEANAEVEVTTSACPTLTSGSPYQDFGTDSSAHYSSNTEVYLLLISQRRGISGVAPRIFLAPMARYTGTRS
jgi:hypothetical protein